MGINLMIGILGVIIGSFLNVVIYRVPKEESIVSPGSHCPKCGQALRAWELIPIISYLIQRGRCRSCRAKVSWRYPMVELLTGCFFYLAGTLGFLMGLHPARVLFNLVFISFLIALSFIDLDTYRLPDVLTIPLWGLGLLGAFLIPGSPSGWESILSSLGAGGFFGLIAKFYPQGMGLGDVKLVAGLGAFLGFPGIFLAVFAGSLLGAIIGLAFLGTGRKGFCQQIPFGPYLSLGAVLALLWKTRIFDWYWAWVK
ncbi:A24 family peptidase [Desulfosporosinus sp. FKA]|uniref:prepilin peptidase n=1 Tax=Desulfosporosinus sp. FKA TaxID=1969834 RepID=UPI000B4A2C64|nr:A24 family peptidase [Desulfosporosinus sp. FKA]